MMAKASTRTPQRAAGKKEQRTWIVVADGGRARILESAHAHSGVAVRLELTSSARLTGGKLAADRLPRTQESGGAARHGIEPRLKLKDHEKRLFAARLADYLKGGLGNFDQLVVVAPTGFLNLLRGAFPDAVAKKISATRNKDLTWMTDAEVLGHLGQLGREVRRLREGV